MSGLAREADAALISELGRRTSTETFDEQPVPELNSEAIDFAAASQCFAERRPLRREDVGICDDRRGEIHWIQDVRTLADELACLLKTIQAMEDIEIAGERSHVDRGWNLLLPQAIRSATTVVTFKQMTQRELRRHSQAQLRCDVS